MKPKVDHISEKIQITSGCSTIYKTVCISCSKVLQEAAPVYNHNKQYNLSMTTKTSHSWNCSSCGGTGTEQHELNESVSKSNSILQLNRSSYSELIAEVRYCNICKFEYTTCILNNNLGNYKIVWCTNGPSNLYEMSDNNYLEIQRIVLDTNNGKYRFDQCFDKNLVELLCNYEEFDLVISFKES